MRAGEEKPRGDGALERGERRASGAPARGVSRGRGREASAREGSAHAGVRADVREVGPLVALDDGKVIGRLKVHPECRTGAEEAREAGCRIRRDAAPLVHDVCDAGGRYAKGHCQSMGGDAKRLEELFVQDFARVGANAHGGLLVVVDDFHVMRCAIAPDKAHTPLVVDADAVLPLPVALEGFEPVRGGNAQVVQAYRRIEHVELAQGHCGERLKATARAAVEKAAGLLTAE